jgi:hypothetical protein
MQQHKASPLRMEQTQVYSWHHHVDVRSPFGMMDAFNATLALLGSML